MNCTTMHVHTEGFDMKRILLPRVERKREKAMCITVKMNCMTMHVHTEGFDIKTMLLAREKVREGESKW